MAINQNHPFEELNGVKCGIAERNASPERVAFLKELLEHNGYEVVVVASPPPKVAAAPKPAAPAGAATAAPTAGTATAAPTGVGGETAPAPQPADTIAPAAPPPPPAPETFTVGVTDYTFNTVNAIFGRLLRTQDGHVVTRDYWYQRGDVALDDIPYYESKK